MKTLTNIAFTSDKFPAADILTTQNVDETFLTACSLSALGRFSILNACLGGFLIYCRLPRGKELIVMALAPLRKIVFRTIEVFTSHRDRPQKFAIREELECGHISTSLLWDYLDLVNAYSENPDVRARRRQCKPCAEMVAKKRPQSVGLAEAKRFA